MFLPTPCWFPDSPAAGHHTCGVVRVVANRESGVGAIDLGVVVFASPSPSKRSDPVVFLHDRALGKSFGAHYAIDCQGRGVAPETAGRADLFPLTAQYAAVCGALGLRNEDPLAQPQHPSSIPTLILTGALDPITPRTTSDTAARDFSRAQIVELPGQGHAVTGSSPCAREIMRAFIEEPEAPLDRACVASLPPVEFATDVAYRPGVFRFANDLLVTPRLGLWGAIVACALVLTIAAVGRVRRLRLGVRRGEAALGLGSGLGAMSALAGVIVTVAVIGSGPGRALLVFGLPGWSVALLWLARGAALAAGAHALWLALSPHERRGWLSLAAPAAALASCAILWSYGLL